MNKVKLKDRRRRMDKIEKRQVINDILTEIQDTKDNKVTIQWLNGNGYPPAVTIKKDDGELISWNFMKDTYGGGYYAEGHGRPWPSGERKRFDKCLDLGQDREKAIDTYYRLIAQTKKPQ